MTIRAHFDGKVFVPVDPVDLPKDHLVELEVREADEHGDELKPGSPAALLRAMRELPRVPKEDVDEMMRMIEQGKVPPVEAGVFDEDHDDHEDRGGG